MGFRHQLCSLLEVTLGERAALSSATLRSCLPLGRAWKSLTCSASWVLYCLPFWGALENPQRASNTRRPGSLGLDPSVPRGHPCALSLLFSTRSLSFQGRSLPSPPRLILERGSAPGPVGVLGYLR